MKWLGWAVLLVAVVVVGLAVGLPNTTLAWLRADYAWLGRPLNRIEHLSDAVGMVHVLMFAVLAGAARLAFSHARTGTLAAAVAAFAVLTELVQFAVPGRTPRLTDVAEDLLGAAVGLAAGAAILWLRRRCMRAPR